MAHSSAIISDSTSNASPSLRDESNGIDALLAVGRGGGALCNDPTGLCLGSRGLINTSKSGIYTTIAKLASQLDSSTGGTSGNSEIPLITMETEEAAYLIKEYDGHTVTLRVPVITGKKTDAENDINPASSQRKEAKRGLVGNASFVPSKQQ